MNINEFRNTREERETLRWLLEKRLEEVERAGEWNEVGIDRCSAGNILEGLAPEEDTRGHAMIECERCLGDGQVCCGVPEMVATCCGNPMPNGECCGAMDEQQECCGCPIQCPVCSARPLKGRR